MAGNGSSYEPSGVRQTHDLRRFDRERFMSAIQNGMTALTVALAVIAARSIGLWGEGAPSPGSTYPLFLLLPAILGVPRGVLALAYAGCFAPWSKQLFSGHAAIPRRSLILSVIASMVSIYVFLTDWQDGVTYQGTFYVRTVLLLDLMAMLLLIVLAALNRRTPSLSRSALFHFALFAWLCTFAVPYMGDAP